MVVYKTVFIYRNLLIFGENMDQIITRFPPSPSGYLHIGGARTALFNWLYARANKGKFVLRIEDTDKARSTKESVAAIFESLEWLGIDWDEGPFFQSERADIHIDHIEKLVKTGHAYYCNCSPEEVDVMREQAKALGKKPMYNGKCREESLPRTENSVVRLKTPATGVTIVDDVVKGSTAFQNSEIDDFIIQRSDGSAMYNLAVVVDDITMGINTIIRGDDHLINTPKQILIYNALSVKLPVFGHVPMVLGADKSRLSKRHGAMSVGEYKNMGYLADAMINYLVRLGWSHGDQEFFTRQDLIEKFSLKSLGKSASMFDIDKLKSLNAKHIQATSPEILADQLIPLLKENNINTENDQFTQNAIATLQPRSKNLVDMAQSIAFYYMDTVVFDEKIKAKNLKPENIESMGKCLENIDVIKDFTQENLEAAFKKVMEETQLGFGKIAQPLRIALTGTNVSPGIFEMILTLGKEKTITRIQKAIEIIENNV
jgi:glutamyl-tRNA synthetase